MPSGAYSRSQGLLVGVHRSQSAQNVPRFVLLFSTLEHGTASSLASLRASAKREYMGLENVISAVKNEIDKLTQVLGLLRGWKKPKFTRARRRMSAAGRKRIAAAQRARWGKIKLGKK